MEGISGVVFLGVLFGFSVFSVFKPRHSLRITDMFRIKGKREYTQLAIEWTVIGGIFMSCLWGTALYFYIDFLINQ